MNYGQIAQYFDIPRKIGWIFFKSSKPRLRGKILKSLKTERI